MEVVIVWIFFWIKMKEEDSWVTVTCYWPLVLQNIAWVSSCAKSGLCMSVGRGQGMLWEDTVTPWDSGWTWLKMQLICAKLLIWNASVYIAGPMSLLTRTHQTRDNGKRWTFAIMFWETKWWVELEELCFALFSVRECKGGKKGIKRPLRETKKVDLAWGRQRQQEETSKLLGQCGCLVTLRKPTRSDNVNELGRPRETNCNLPRESWARIRRGLPRAQI